MNKVYLFYGSQLVAERDGRELRSGDIQSQYGQEIYDGGYIYSPKMTTTWWRCDITPVLLADVPKELRALALLLT